MRTLVILTAALAAACAHSVGGGFDGNGNGGGAGGDDGTGGGNVLGNGNGSGGGQVLLYAHTDTTLYQLDPTNLAAPMTTVGTFDCTAGGAGAMTDLAVAKDGSLYGVSEGAAYPLQVESGGVVHCASRWTLPNTKFYGLTIAPEGVLGSNEVLVGADGKGGIYEIDPSSGAPTQVGTLGTDPSSGLAWSLSGDVVFMANGGNPIGFATVRTCKYGGTCSTTDTLIEVDVHAIHPGMQSVMKAVRGPVVKGSWCSNPASPATFGSMFGIAAYQDKVYGFSRTGDIVEIHNDDGSGCLLSAQPSLRFAGAGVTTSAPVKAPAPK